MKTLQQTIEESLRFEKRNPTSVVNEGEFDNYKVYSWSWEEPPTICKQFPKYDEEGNKINTRYWYTCNLGKGKGNLAWLTWNTDGVNACIIKAENFDDFRKKFDKAVETELKKYPDDTEFEFDTYTKGLDELDVYVYVNFDKLGGRKDIKTDIQTVWDQFVKSVENSEVNGDSDSCMALVDLKKKETLLIGQPNYRQSGVEFDY